MLLTCREARLRIEDFCDGLLSKAESLAVEEHVAHCATCRRRLLAERSFRALLRAAREVTPPPHYFESLFSRLTARLEAEQTRRRRLSYAASWAALASVVTTLTIFLVQKPAEPLPRPLRKPIAAGWTLRPQERRNFPPPTANKSVPERIEVSRDVVWASLVEQKRPAAVEEILPTSMESLSPEPETSDTWLAFAVPSADSPSLWKYETQRMSEPDILPPVRRSETEPTPTPSESGLPAFVSVAMTVVSEPTLPVEIILQKHR